MADIKAIAEQLVNLTVKEVSELAAILKDEYGIETAAAAVVVAAGGDAAAEEEKTSLALLSSRLLRPLRNTVVLVLRKLRTS